MLEKRVGISKRKKSEVCTDIQKHSPGKTEYAIFCIYKIIYKRQFDCQVYRLCVKYEKSQKIAQKSFRLFCSALKQKSRNFARGLILWACWQWILNSLCKWNRLSVNQIFNTTAKCICEADHYVDLCFADVILPLLIELDHAERYAGGVAQLLLRKPTCPADFRKFVFSVCFISGNDFIGSLYKLAFVCFMENVHGKHRGKLRPPFTIASKRWPIFHW